ncbi:MAG: creatininase family protein [Candidatus Lokiarchaeota archaeon]|nr:creatininase family protein [Candidatus Lokiarchaeota archaeon]
MYREYIYLRPKELDEEIKRFPLAFVPLGALEWHSYHLPLGTDGLKVDFLLRKTAEKMAKGVLFPTKFWGAFRTMRFPWTFNFPRAGQGRFYRYFLKKLYKMGFRMIILLTGHYPEGMVRLLKRTCKNFMRSHQDCYVLGITEYFLLSDFGYFGDHAARWETSLEMVANPEHVNLSELPKDYSFIQRAMHLGITGQDPLLTSSEEEGRNLIEAFSNRLSLLIEKVWEKKNQQPFLDVYNDYYSKRVQLFKRKNRDKRLKVLGWDSKKDMWNYLKWLFQNGARHVKVKDGALPSDNLGK